MIEDKWTAYAGSWSQPQAARDAALRDLVADTVTYCDPGANVTGRAAFSAHMAQFQKDMPGTYFEIRDVMDHHGRSLANWTLCNRDGDEVMKGTSFATLSEDGRFTSFTGFF